MQRIARVTLVMAVLATFGCNGDPEPNTTATPIPTSTPTPTATPVSTPTPTPTPTPSSTATAAANPRALSRVARDGEVTVAEAQAIVDHHMSLRNPPVLDLTTTNGL